jgi:hypothetical protein
MADDLCPVCGYVLGFPAWDGDSQSDEICPSCGIQFGYQDATGGDVTRRSAIHRDWRSSWIARGMPWSGAGPAPKDWDPSAQLRRLFVVVSTTARGTGQG